MKALTLWQPWASLIAIGAKRVETRHWPAPDSVIGQRLAIHAARTRDHLEVCAQRPFSDHLPDAEDLPLGAIVCTVTLVRCALQTDVAIRLLRYEQPDEHAFGYYLAGRFAWVLSDVEPVIPPEEIPGGQGIWDVDQARRRRDQLAQQRLQL